MGRGGESEIVKRRRWRIVKRPVSRDNVARVSGDKNSGRSGSVAFVCVSFGEMEEPAIIFMQ